MKLTHRNLETAFSEENINVLYCENPTAFRDMYSDLKNSLNGDENGFVLSTGNEIVKLSKYGLLISNPLDMDFNEKKINNRLISELSEIALNKFEKESATVKETMYEFLYKLQSESPVNIDWFCDTQITALLKAFDVKISCDYDSYAEKLIAYISAAISLLGIKSVFFVNLKSYMTRSELTEIYKFLRYNKLFSFLLENKVYKKIDGEFSVILDDDLCEIIA